MNTNHPRPAGLPPVDSLDLQLGLDTFGDMTVAPDGTALSSAQVVRNVLAQAQTADRSGVDVFGIGEHHRDDYAVSAPDVVLAAAASTTERIRLGTSVTVLSSDDPVRVFERFSTLDAVSRGRAEVALGRGSFTESFPLFGYDLADYDQLFAEKLDLFTKLLPERPVAWEGQLRPSLRTPGLMPRTEHGLRAWIAVGGSPESVVRAAHYGLPLMLAIIGGPAERFAPFVQLYRRALAEQGRDAPPVGVHSHGHVAETDQEARDQLREHWVEHRTRMGRERGWGPATAEQFDAEMEHGALYVGSPETVARKIARTVRLLGLSRFTMKYSNGPIPHEDSLRGIELYGTEVIPRVRELLGSGEEL